MRSRRASLSSILLGTRPAAGVGRCSPELRTEDRSCAANSLGIIPFYFNLRFVGFSLLPRQVKTPAPIFPSLFYAIVIRIRSPDQRHGKNPPPAPLCRQLCRPRPRPAAPQLRAKAGPRSAHPLIPLPPSTPPHSLTGPRTHPTPDTHPTAPSIHQHPVLPRPLKSQI